MEKVIGATFEKDCLRLLKYSNVLSDAIAKNLPEEDLKKAQENVDVLRESINRNYAVKLKNNVYQSRIKNIDAMLSGNKNNIIIENFAKRLEKVMNIMNSNKSDYVKVQALTDIYGSHMELIQDYYDLVPEFLYTRFMTCLSDATNLMRSYSKNMADLIYDKNLSKFNEVYDYARFIIQEYFNSENEDKDKFLKKYGINEDTFEYCVKVIQNLDVDLYNHYLIIDHLRNIDRIKSVIDSIDYIYESIQFEQEENKYFNDLNNEPKSKWVTNSIRDVLFNDIDFLKANKFKNSKKFSVEFPIKARKFVITAASSIDDQTEKDEFINKYNEKIDVIKNYMSTNPNTITRALRDISKEENGFKYYLKNQKILVSQSEIDTVLAYMRANNLPFSSNVFESVAKEFVNYKLDLTNISLDDYKSEDNQRCLIIPSSYERPKR